MSDEQFALPAAPSDGPGGEIQLRDAAAAAAAPPVWDEGFYPPSDDGDGGIDFRRYLVSILRHKWLVASSLLVGVVGSVFVWSRTAVTYTAEGNLWIEAEARTAADLGPNEPSGLLQDNAWVELLESFQVLDTVAVRERLFLRVPADYEPAFQRFSLADEVGFGTYVLRVSESGADFVLTTDDGTLVQQAAFGVPIGENVGFRWNPAPGSFPPEAVVRFRVLTARDAGQQLRDQLQTQIDRAGNFIRLTLSGPNPEKIASILNAVMDRHVTIAAELKRNKLDQTLIVLEEQLTQAEAQLQRSERSLEEFRVSTISLPTDQSMPIAPGLQITRDPTFGNFFDMRVRLDELQQDRRRLQAVIDDFGQRDVRIEALELIPATAGSSELRRILDELVDARSELRALRDRYSDDYPPIQDLLNQIESIETTAIPRVVLGIMRELEDQEAELSARLATAQAELQAIPPRTIEEQRLSRQVATNTDLYNQVRGRVESARLAAASSIPDVRILDPARVPNQPSDDERMLRAGLVFFGCFGLGLLGAVLLDRVDARFRFASDVGRVIGLDILGSIPRIESANGRRGVLNAAQALEAFRELRIHVSFAYGSAGPITLAVTSPAPNEGKSMISSNLAVAFSEVGRRTLLIDGDTRRGDAHRLLGRERSPGLIDHLRGETGQDIIQATDHPNLDFIGCGSRGVSTPELLASPRMAYFIGTLKRTYDVIIIDCPPLASGGDPLILGSLTGNLAVVIRTGATEKALAQAKIDQLSRLPIRILGAILNDVSAHDTYHSYYASYLPSYEPVPEEGDEVPTQILSGPSDRELDLEEEGARKG